MNREQRRKATRENRKSNSKKNFIDVGVQAVPIDQIVHDPNLKECDPDITDLYMKVFRWQEKDVVKQKMSKALILSVMEYLDSLCALRFDITPVEDKVLIRDTMGHIANMANWFIGNCLERDDRSISEKAQYAYEVGTDKVRVTMPLDAEKYELRPLPENEAIDDMYAGFVVKHAHELAPLLAYTKFSEVEKDMLYVFEVLEMLTKKTKELMPEAQVSSERFIVQM